jgi:hypothetical protein
MQLNDCELDGQFVAKAKAMGARAIFTMTLTPATSSAGSGVSLGIGGFRFRGSGGAGDGRRAPIGGSEWSTGYAANGPRATEVSNRLVWAATLVAARSAALNAQFATLLRSLLHSAQDEGLF